MTYNELLTNLQAWIEDDGVEFEGSIPEIIKLAEQTVQRDLDLGIFCAVNSRAATIGNQLLVRPAISGSLAFVQLYTDVSSVRYWIEHRSVDFVTDYLSDMNNGIPKYYAEYDETQFILAPRPASTYSIVGRAVIRPTRLSASNPVTWIGDNVPELLFKACLHEAEGFVKDDPRTQMWKEQYKMQLASVKRDVMPLLMERYQLTPMEVPAQPTPAR